MGGRHGGPENPIPAIGMAGIQSGNGTAFAFSSGNLRAEEMAEIFVKALPKIMLFLEEEQAPFLATITKSGHVQMLKR